MRFALALVGRAAVAFLAGRDAPGVALGVLENTVGYETVVDDDICLLQALLGAQGEQVGIARAGANE